MVSTRKEKLKERLASLDVKILNIGDNQIINEMREDVLFIIGYLSALEDTILGLGLKLDRKE